MGSSTARLLGLPGNPVAAFVTFVHVEHPLAAQLAGEAFTPPLAVPGARGGSRIARRKGRREYVRARLIPGRRRRHRGAQAPARGAAGVITSLTQTDGLVELPETARAVEPGQTVGFLPYAALR